MMRQYELVEKVASYDSHVDEDLLNRAYVFSLKAHGSQQRANGDPYFSHPVEVAGILTDYRLDCTTIATALLHDTVEDTVATLEQIQESFGPDVAKLVDGVTKLSKLELRSEQSKQAENFRKLLVAMSTDIRVLLVKLADRLHNMRTLHFLRDPERRRRIAAETMDIYAPLAERIGMHRLKEELEDAAFRELNPEAHGSVVARLRFLSEKSGDLVPLITEELRGRLRDAGIEAEVLGREKRPYSIWRKMQKHNVGFEQLSDIVGFRILIDEPSQCYQALGVVHRQYPAVPGRFKDYVSTPKRNQYRSLHTTVIGPRQQRIEIQIRTHEMHQVAEFGVAAHWSYKQTLPGTATYDYRWLHELLEILEQASSPEEFLEHTKLEMFRDQVFCFTPTGEVIALPRGATPVDFAYAVHTAIGDTCVGAKVNGRVVPLRSEIMNGDQVEILRAKDPGPNPNWESFVVTGRARSAIRRFVRNQQREQYRRLGRSIGEKAFATSGHEFSEKAIEQAAKLLRLRGADEVYVELGQGHLTARELLAKIFPGERWRAKGAIQAINRVLPARLRRRKKGPAVPIRGLTPGLAVHYGECCHPLPGDRIVGIVSKGEGVIIHTIDCGRLADYNDEPERWLDVQWEVDAQSQEMHVGRLRAVLTNEPGSLSSLSTVIAKNMGNISNLTFTNRGPDFFEARVDIEVADVKHLTDIIAALRVTPQVSSVDRLRG